MHSSSAGWHACRVHPMLITCMHYAKGSELVDLRKLQRRFQTPPRALLAIIIPTADAHTVPTLLENVIQLLPKITFYQWSILCIVVSSHQIPVMDHHGDVHIIT